MNRKIAILVAAMLLLLVPTLSAISWGADAVDGSISYVSYDMDEEKLSFTGSTSSVSNGTATMTLQGISDATVTKTSTCAIASGGYDGRMDVGVLERGSYKLTATASNKVIGERVFSIAGLISVNDVSFDADKLEVSFSGKTNLSSVDARVIGSYESDFVPQTVIDYAFSGKISMTEYKQGSMILSVTNTMYHCEVPIDTGKFVSIKGFGYDFDTHKVTWSGISTEKNVSVELFDASNAKKLGAFSAVNDGSFAGETTVVLSSGSYKLKVTSLSDTAVNDESLKTFSNIIVDTTSNKNLSIYTGEYSEVTLTVTNGEFSDLSTSVGNSSIARAGTISSDGKMKIHGESPGSTTVTVYSGQSEVVFNVTVSNKVLPPSMKSYSFELKILDINDAEVANVGSSGLSVNDLLHGITLTSNGYDAGSALESALNSYGIPCSFWTGNSGGQEMKHWVDQIMDLGDVQLDNGNWKYWIQTKGGSYNQWTLGYYTDGGSFELTYGITNEEGQVIKPTNPDTPTPTPSHTHSWGEGTVSKAPTCIETGVRTYTCDCGETRTETIPALGHKWSEWTVVKQATDEEDGLKERTCSVCGEKETETIAKTVIVINDDGTTTKTEVELDGTVVSTTTGAEDGSTKIDKVKEDVDENGNQITTNSSEVKDKDGNTTSSSNVVKDAEGNEIYSKTEEFVPEATVTDDSGNQITTSSSTSVEKEAGRTTETETESTTTLATDGSKESVTTTVETITEADGGTAVKIVEESVKESADGAKEIEVVSVENISSADGSTTEKTVTESTKQSADGSTETSKVTEVVKEDEETVLSSTQTETKDATGKETFEKKVEAESKDGSMKSTVEIPQEAEKAEIVTVVKTDSDDGRHSITAEQVQQAISIQEKVSQEISGDVKEQTKVIQVESETSDAALTVSQDAVKAVSESGSGLRISSEKGSLTASSQVLGNISEEDEITISITEAKDEGMNDSQKETVSDNVVVDVKIMSGDKSLGSMLGGTITISVKYTPATGKIAVAYYVDDNGGKERMEGSSYDPAKGEVSFESTHCSLYMIVDEDAPAESSGNADNTLLYIGIAAVVIILIITGAVLYMRRN